MMRWMPTPATLLWFAMILLQAAAAVQLWRAGLVQRFPVLTTWFAYWAAVGPILFFVGQLNPAYPPLYSIACMFGILLEAGVVVEAFFAMSGKFRNFSRIGGSLLLVLWMIAAASSAAVRLSWVPEGWVHTWQLAMLGARHADLAMAVVLGASWLILRVPGVQIPRSANRVTLIVLGHALYGWVVSSLTIAKGDTRSLWATLLPLLGGCFTALAAVSLLRTFEGEYELPPAPAAEEMRAAIRDANLAYLEFHQEAADLERELFDE